MYKLSYIKSEIVQKQKIDLKIWKLIGQAFGDLQQEHLKVNQ